MPQSPLSDLVITNAGTIIRQVDTVQFTGDGVTITPGTPNPRVAVVNIPGGGGGSPTLAAGALLGNPGTIAAPGTSVVVGTGLTMTNDGSLEATGGGGGGNYAAGLGLAFDTITSPGTTTINNTGTMVQLNSTGTTALGVTLKAGGISNPGTAGYIQAPGVEIAGADIILTDPGGGAYGGEFLVSLGTITNGTVHANSAYFSGTGSYVIGTSQASGASFLAGGGDAHGASTNRGGGVQLVGGKGENFGGYTQLDGGDARDVEGNYTNGTAGSALVAGGGAGTLGLGGHVILRPGAGATNGLILATVRQTADPMVTYALWRDTITNAAFISAGP